MSQRTQYIVAAIVGVILVGVVLFQVTRKPPAPPPTKGGRTPATANRPVAVSPPAASSDARKAEPVTGELQEVDVDIDGLLAGIQEVDFDYDRERIPRDPLTPLVGTVARRRDDEEAPADDLVPPAILSEVLGKKVSGIVWDKRYPIAVVDNEVVHPGYEYADGTVVDSIQLDRVVFRVGDSLIQVELEEL